MITMKSAISTALKGDTAITGALGGERIYAVNAPNANEYPRITYFEITNFDANHADDAAYSARMLYQIDVWSKGNPDPIAVEVDRVMKSIGFVRTGGTDFYEKDVQVYHRALRYEIIAEVDN